MSVETTSQNITTALATQREGEYRFKDIIFGLGPGRLEEGNDVVIRLPQNRDSLTYTNFYQIRPRNSFRPTELDITIANSIERAWSRLDNQSIAKIHYEDGLLTSIKMGQVWHPDYICDSLVFIMLRRRDFRGSRDFDDKQFLVHLPNITDETYGYLYLKNGYVDEESINFCITNLDGATKEIYAPLAIDNEKINNMIKPSKLKSYGSRWSKLDNEIPISLRYFDTPPDPNAISAD